MTCSTPFGITGTFTESALRGSDHYNLCSTPFGITGTFTLDPVRHRTGDECAQRLSASQVLSRGSIRPQERHQHVLNAFRHHRYFHRNARALLNPSIAGAQRLSASQVLSHWSRRLVRYCACSAQRLSASQVLSLVFLRDPFRLRAVLNAFRHHRYFHICMFSLRALAHSVLNAFRHHRYFHTLHLLCLLRGVAVLNAFRHHRYFHIRISSFIPVSSMCSTPFGITGTFTWTKSRSGNNSRGAQRLSASQVLSLALTSQSRL